MVINKEKEALITQEYLRERLHYDKDTGIFTWTDSKLNANRARGKKAGCIYKNGYRYLDLTVNKKPYTYTAHRLAWFYIYGEFPKMMLDHINHNKLDNRISNLREVTHKENQRNKRVNIRNTSGHTGVSFDKTCQKYKAQVTVDGKNKHFGYFQNVEDAAKAAKEAREHYGFHKNHGAAE